MYVISYNPGVYFITVRRKYIKDFISARPPRDLLLNLLLQKQSTQDYHLFTLMIL
nr:hypothetical protein Cduv_173 [Cedratvirus duvanny]